MSFNQSQTEAIGHVTGPMMVLAGPGSGKTTVITERTKNLVLHHGVDPSRILVITFTKAAALEMKERFLRLMGGRKYPITFGTFHAVFFSDLKICLWISQRKYCQRRTTSTVYEGDYSGTASGI